ncbi:hypothetical protein [Micromonospora zhanjiangensis]|uniref:Uncharacterized protein n=1 Tax=Micromonospora zhanjiangensis TaxID=1522057 RepID=A0ABV8KWH3_9ACTN
MGTFSPSFDEYLASKQRDLQRRLASCKFDQLGDRTTVARFVSDASLQLVELREPAPSPTVLEKPDGIDVSVKWPGSAGIDQFQDFNMEPGSQHHIYANANEFYASKKFPKDVSTEAVREWVLAQRQTLASWVKRFNEAAEVHNARQQALAETIVSERQAVGTRAAEIARDLEGL